MRRRWLLLAGLGALVSLVVSQAVQNNVIDDQLGAQSQSLLNLATDVARQSRQALDTINALPSDPCSPGDLDALRYIVYKGHFLQDAGRSDGRNVTCTALWGVLDKPIVLPAPDRKTGSLVNLWKDAHAVPDQRLTSDMGILGSAVTYTQEGVFHDYEQLSAGLAGVLTTADGAHKFAGFGKESDAVLAVMNGPNGFWGLGGRHSTACSKQFDICAVVRSSTSSAIVRSPGIVMAAVLIGAFGFAGTGYVLHHRLRATRNLDKQLKRAVKKGRFRVAYQPIVRLRDRKIIGVEALARWSNESGETVSPEIFVPAIERLGLLRMLTKNIVSAVVAELEPYLLNSLDFYVSINVGASDLVSTEFHDFLVKETQRRSIDPNRIALEITERNSADMQQLANAVAVLRNAGYRVFIDDFGTGYSGIAYLANMPVDAVKVDRMFTSAACTDSVHARMLEKMCGMISAVGGAILFEGVETEEQVVALGELSSKATAQGWLFGKPEEGTLLMERLPSGG